MEYDYSKLGLSTEELFSRHDHSDLESEKIIAPRYSYWRSVFRVFFRKKLNTVILLLLVAMIAFAYIYPMLTVYDKYGNLLNADAKHLSPQAAIDMFGFQIKYILGTGAAGQSTFDAIWNGSRISISLALICAAINMSIGVVIGAIWGFSKRVDAIMVEVYNILANVPYILLISVLLMLFSTVADYVHGRLIGHFRGKRASKGVLFSSVLINLSVLCFFKYADFLIQTFNAVTGVSVPLLALPLP